MNDIFAEMEADALDASAIPDDKKLEGVAGLAQDMIQLEKQINDTEDHLKDLKRQHQIIQTGKLPEALIELGLTGLPMEDGVTIEVKPFVSASISKANREEAYQWLMDNGHGDIIKNLVSVDVGKDSEQAKLALDVLRNAGLEPSNDKKVHPQTLKAFVREQVEKGTPIPLELLGAYLGQKATIKRK